MANTSTNRVRNKHWAERRERARKINPEFMSAEDVADFTGFSVGYIYLMTHRGTIPYYKPFGGRIHFLRSEIEAWFNDRHAHRTIK